MTNKKKIILILIFILLLIANTYAWFIFNSDVNLAISTQVKRWTIEFKEGRRIVIISSSFLTRSLSINFIPSIIFLFVFSIRFRKTKQKVS